MAAKAILIQLLVAVGPLEDMHAVHRAVIALGLGHMAVHTRGAGLLHDTANKAVEFHLFRGNDGVLVARSLIMLPISIRIETELKHRPRRRIGIVHDSAPIRQGMALGADKILLVRFDSPALCGVNDPRVRRRQFTWVVAMARIARHTDCDLAPEISEIHRKQPVSMFFHQR